MSSHNVNTIKNGAVLVANDLRTGLTVYLAKNGRWNINWLEAWVITDDIEAKSAKVLATNAVANNDVIDPYLVDTSHEGNPTHTRERLRTTGPSVDYLSTSII